MRELVRDHLGDALLHGQRRRRRVGQQRHLAERHRARVLHRARLEVGDADLVQLAERVGQAEVVLQPRQHRRRDVLRERRQLPLLGRGPRRIGTSRAIAIGLGTSGPTTSATRYDDSGGVGANVSAPAAVPVVVVADDAAVRDRDRLVRDARHAQPPHRLERRLVEAREQPARVGRLELRDRDAARAVKAAQARG